MRLNSGFRKWLSSTKFQIAVLAIGLIYTSMAIFDSDPTHMNGYIRDIALGYFGARVVEPLVEFATNKIKRPKPETEIKFDVPIR